MNFIIEVSSHLLGMTIGQHSISTMFYQAGNVLILLLLKNTWMFVLKEIVVLKNTGRKNLTFCIKV